VFIYYADNRVGFNDQEHRGEYPSFHRNLIYGGQIKSAAEGEAQSSPNLKQNLFPQKNNDPSSEFRKATTNND